MPPSYTASAMPPSYTQNQPATATMVHDSDDESVESEIDVDECNEEPIISIDDISVTSREYSSHSRRSRSTGAPTRVTSFESLFGEASVETSLNDHGANEKFESLEDDSDHAPRAPVEVKFSPAVIMRKNNPASGSSGSIRDLLSFGSIHENHDYISDGSSDESSDDEDLSDGFFGHATGGRLIDEDDESISSEFLDNILTKSDSANFMNKSKRMVSTKAMQNAEPVRQSWTPKRNVFMHTNRKYTSARGVGETSSSSSKETKGKVQNEKKGGEQSPRKSPERKTHSSRTDSSSSSKKKISTADPLLDRFLNKVAKKNGKAAAAAPSSSSSRKPSGSSSRTRKPQKVDRDILAANDSLIHMNSRGKRVVRTSLRSGDN